MICVSILGRSLIETSSLGHCLAFDSNNYLLALAIFHSRTFDLLTTGTYPIDRSAKEQSRKSSNNIAVTYLPVRITVLFVRISICHCNICSAQWRHVFPSPFQHTKWIFILFNCAQEQCVVHKLIHLVWQRLICKREQLHTCQPTATNFHFGFGSRADFCFSQPSIFNSVIFFVLWCCFCKFILHVNRGIKV